MNFPRPSREREHYNALKGTNTAFEAKGGAAELLDIEPTIHEARKTLKNRKGGITREEGFGSFGQTIIEKDFVYEIPIISPFINNYNCILWQCANKLCDRPGDRRRR